MNRKPLLEPVIGSMSPEAQASKLREMTAAPETDAEGVDRASGEVERGLFRDKPWGHVSHLFGYIAPGVGKLAIQGSGSVEADQTLIGQRVVVRLDRIYVQEYPGFGEHAILFTFKAQNQTDIGGELACFSRTYRGKDGEAVATQGQPIFVGLNVGKQGIGFECATVNVKSKGDAQILDGLASSTVGAGLELLTAAQPVLKPFAQMTLGLAKVLAGRSSNAAVQDFYLGLDFDAQGIGARLREGSYVAMQAPDTVDWADWEFDANKQLIVGKGDATMRPYYNYIIFRVSKA